MIVFKQVRFKNFLSSGNVQNTIDLNTTKKTIITGTNGSGKTTMNNAIQFALFGKTFRAVTKAQYINSINGKGCLVELDFTAHGKEYTVRRGLKPAIFEVIQDNVPVELDAAVRDTQTWLEETVLKTNLSIFTQIISVGTGSYIPFMQLSAGQRRDLVEHFLDLSIITQMNIALKGKIGSWKQDHESVQFEIEQTRKLMDSLVQVHSSNEDSQKARIERLREHLSDAISLIETKKEERKVFAEKIEESDYDEEAFREHRRRSLEIQKELATIEYQLGQSQDLLQYLEEHSHCEKCEQPITEEHKKKIRAKSEKQSEDLTQEGDERRRLFNESEQAARTFDQKQRDLRENQYKLKELEHSIKHAKKVATDLITQIEQEQSTQTQDLSDKIREAEITLRGLEKRERQLIEQKPIFEYVKNLFKDTGIRSQIIKQYIPMLNKLVNKYLSQLGFNVLFELDENFKERLRSRHRDDFTYESFSMGERQRIDLALLFAWREIASIRSALSTNLLIFDEVFDASVDNDGVENMFEIIDNLPATTNVFVISHRGDTMGEKFDRHIHVIKENSFSVYTET